MCTYSLPIPLHITPSRGKAGTYTAYPVGCRLVQFHAECKLNVKSKYLGSHLNSALILAGSAYTSAASPGRRSPIVTYPTKQIENPINPYAFNSLSKYILGSELVPRNFVCPNTAMLAHAQYCFLPSTTHAITFNSGM